MDITYVFTLSSGGRAYLNSKEGAVSKKEINEKKCIIINTHGANQLTPRLAAPA